MQYHSWGAYTRAPPCTQAGEATDDAGCIVVSTACVALGNPFTCTGVLQTLPRAHYVTITIAQIAFAIELSRCHATIAVCQKYDGCDGRLGVDVQGFNLIPILIVKAKDDTA